MAGIFAFMLYAEIAITTVIIFGALLTIIRIWRN